MPAEKKHASLTEALAAVQAHLPTVGKSETATVRSDKGTYSYSYADLAQITKAVMPLLSANGLAWLCRPTVVDGRFVLAYELRHVSGEKESGEYPLSGSTPQQHGSAITYARRYCLCSVTGVAPESDDDDAKAASHRPMDDDRRQEPPAAPPQPTTAQRAKANELRDRALTADTKVQFSAIWKEGVEMDVLAMAVQNEHGDMEELGALVRRRGEPYAKEPAAGSAPEGEQRDEQ